METNAKKIAVNIQRVGKRLWATKSFCVFVDGEELLTLSNGERARFFLAEGTHEISVHTGSAVHDTLLIEDNAEEEINLICEATNAGRGIIYTTVELRRTNVDTSPEATNTVPENGEKPRASGGAILVFIILILLLLGITITVKVDFSVLPT